MKRRRSNSDTIAARVVKRARLSRAVIEDEDAVEILPLMRLEDISAPIDANWNEWVSATHTRNYMLKDPICDWLAAHYSKLATSQPRMSTGILQAVGGRRSAHNFTQYIMDQGIEFESHVLCLLIKKLGSDMIAQIGGELNSHSPAKIQETVDAMMRGVPIIHSGLLHNPRTRTFGIPDLLVRSDWLDRLVSLSPYTAEDKVVPAVRLRDVHDVDTIPRYHYVVVDIKFSTLYLRADATHLLNCGSFPAYKAQLYIYNEALALIQGYKPARAFVLGRKWCFTIRGASFKGRSCFDRLGAIDYTTVDLSYAESAMKAVEWVRAVRTAEAGGWQITNYPLSRPELYPNMSNTHDYPWHSVKSLIAEETKEISALWMMGVKNRKIMHEKHSIYQWTDPRCNVDTLGVTGLFTRRVLKAILNINRPTVRPRTQKVRPALIKDNRGEWQTRPDLEFYVDFETVNDVTTNFSTLPEVESSSMIFMIGIGYIEPVTTRWVFKEFTVDRLVIAEEGRICAAAAMYIRSEASFYEVERPKCLHWGAAENIHWTAAVAKHYPASNQWKSDEWEWFDLLQVFRQEPIVIEGCLSFGLKAVATALKGHGYIATGWDTDSACLDGQGAMIGAWNSHNQARSQGISMRNTPVMREIIRYNEVDVKVVYEIITYLRLSHTRRAVPPRRRVPRLRRRRPVRRDVQFVHSPVSVFVSVSVFDEARYRASDGAYKY